MSTVNTNFAAEAAPGLALEPSVGSWSVALLRACKSASIAQPPVWPTRRRRHGIRRAGRIDAAFAQRKLHSMRITRPSRVRPDCRIHMKLGRHSETRLLISKPAGSKRRRRKRFGSTPGRSAEACRIQPYSTLCQTNSSCPIRVLRLLSSTSNLTAISDPCCRGSFAIAGRRVILEPETA